MNFCLDELFTVICNNDLPCAKREEDLFGFVQETHAVKRQYGKDDIDLLSGYFSGYFASFDRPAQSFMELSFNVFDSIIHAWMSELPIEPEIIAFGRKALAAAQSCGSNEEKRLSAEKAAADRGEESVRTVLAAVSKVQLEAHRMMGLLRFSPDSSGTYTALCEPDHLIIPALGEYFSSRFGETPWVIIDVKRGLRLSRLLGEKAKLAVMETAAECCTAFCNDEWEELWRHYHRTVNNESRKNLHLQRQLMPKRYWKYLPEM